MPGEWPAPRLSRTVRALLTFGRADNSKLEIQAKPGGKDAVVAHSSGGAPENNTHLKAVMARFVDCPPERWGINE